MTDIIYKIEFFSDWHAGSGLTAGADVDLLVIKDKHNLPFISGKTLKGLLKDAAQDLYEFDTSIDKNMIDKIYGKEAIEAEKTKNNESIPSIPGSANFSNAELSLELKNKLKYKEKNELIDKTNFLYRKISSTAINEAGQAKEHSLRRIEVTVPLVLFAKISNIENDDQENFIEKCMQMIKRMGSGRNRGLGRCQLSIEKEKI